jgi:hypothetical protein
MLGVVLQGAAGGAIIRPGRFWVAHCSFRKFQLAFAPRHSQRIIGIPLC